MNMLTTSESTNKAIKFLILSGIIYTLSYILMPFFYVFPNLTYNKDSYEVILMGVILYILFSINIPIFIYFYIKQLIKGKNWSRILLTIAVIFGTILFIDKSYHCFNLINNIPDNILEETYRSYNEYLLGTFFDGVTTILNIIAIVFLYQKDSSEHFSKTK